MLIEFTLNGKQQIKELEADESLLDVLRREFAQDFLREGCRRGHCGACTVLMDDQPAAACLIPAFNLQGANIETISALMKKSDFQHIEAGYLRTGFHPCKYCSPAKIIITESILRRSGPAADEETILRYTRDSWCSCTSPSAFVKAVQAADTLRRKRRSTDAHRR